MIDRSLVALDSAAVGIEPTASLPLSPAPPPQGEREKKDSHLG
ncbi:MAG: hypothetical protein ABI471_10590 [Sphingomonas bacterium]